MESLCQWECLEGGVLSVYWGGVMIFYVDWSVWGRGSLFYVSLSGLRGGVLLILMSTEVISGGGVINFLCQLECFGRGRLRLNDNVSWSVLGRSQRSVC